MNGYTTTTTVQQQTLGYQPSSPETHKKRLQIVRGLGVVEVVIGIISLAAGVAATIITKGQGYIVTGATGIWGGAWFIIAGGLGIATVGSSNPRCMVIAHMTVSILGSLTAFGQSLWSGLLAAGSFVVRETQVRGSEASEIATGLYACYTIIAILSAIAFIVLIVSASFCCCALPGCCCGESVETGHVMVVQGTTQQAQPVQVQQSNHPGTGYPGGPGYAPL